MTHWLPDAAERRRLQWWALIALALHLVAAVRSAGWFSYDEHWQVLEFANAIQGRTPRTHLPWEYAAHARPSLQSWIYAGLDSFAHLNGETNPFRIAALFRIFSAICAWAATMLAGIAVLRTLPASAARRWVGPALALTWFLPYLHARTSSENASETAFLFGFALLLLNQSSPVPSWGKGRATAGEGVARSGTLTANKALLIGLLFGLAFEFRFQTGLMVAGAVLWSAFIDKQRLGRLVAMAGGLVVAIVGATLADTAFYGTWTFAPWNYLRVNIIEHRADSFGTSPWWSYFTWMPEKAGPPLSLVLMMGTIGGWFRHRRSILTWSMVPFFVVHMVLAHKEPRFLFPLATLSLLMTFVFFADVKLPRWSVFVAGFLLVEDLVLLAGASVLPSQPAMTIYERVYALGSPTQIYFQAPQPYRFSDDMFMHFYAPRDLTMTPVDDYADLKRHIDHGALWYIEKRFAFPPEAADVAKKCVADTTTLPEWTRQFDFNGWVGRQPAWTLYRCKP